MNKHITIGVAGHRGHGKTNLARCLNALGQSDNILEKCNNFSNQVEISEFYVTPEIRAALMDVPGHPRLMKTAIRGLSGADMAILVVAADDGVMPQTLEHIKIIHHLKISDGLIVLAKADLVDVETLELAELEIREALQNTVLADKPVIPFSAVTGTGREALIAQIQEVAAAVPVKNPDADFRMWIDEINSIPGFGTVARGCIVSGSVSQGDPLWLLPLCRETRARTLEVHHRKVAEAFSGQRVGVNLPKIALKEIHRGMTLVKKKPESLFLFLNAEISADAPIKNLQRVKLYIGTSVSNALAVFMDHPRLEPGQTGLVQFRLPKPLFAVVGGPFLICGLNTHTVIGGGRILEATHEKFRAAKSERLLLYLTALRRGDRKEAILRHISNRSHRLVSLSEISFYTGIPAGDVRRLTDSLIAAGELISCGDETVLLAKTHAELGEKIYQTVTDVFLDDPLKKAAGREEIRQIIGPATDESMLKSVLNGLCEQNRIVKVKGGYALSGFSPCFNHAQQKLADILMDFAANAGLLPFSPGHFCIKTHHHVRKNDVQKVLDFLHEQGKLIHLNDNNYLHTDMLEEIMVRVKNAIGEKGSIRMSDSLDVLGYGRSKAALVFEYLDEIGFTCREGDERRLAHNS